MTDCAVFILCASLATIGTVMVTESSSLPSKYISFERVNSQC